MSQPRFLGPDAELALHRWVQVNFSRNLYKRMNAIVKRMQLYQLDDDTEIREINLHNSNFYEGNLVIYSREEEELFNALMEINGVTENLALELVNVYHSSEELAQESLETLSKLSFRPSEKKRKRRVGKKRANDILNDIKEYI